MHNECPLTDIFISQLVTEPDSLWLMFNRFAIHDGYTEVLSNRLVDSVTLHKLVVDTQQGMDEGARLTKSSTVRLVARSTTGCV